MNCPRCGDDSHDSDRFCSTCGMDLVTYRNLWPRPASTASPDTALAAPAVAPADASPPAPQAPTETDTPRVPNYLGWAAALIAICWPAFWAGIPALMHAGRVDAHLAAGDLVGARAASEKAKTWCWVTFLAGLVMWAIFLALIALL